MGCRPDLQAPQMWLQTLCVYALWPSGFGFADTVKIIIIIIIMSFLYSGYQQNLSRSIRRRVKVCLDDHPLEELFTASMCGHAWMCREAARKTVLQAIRGSSLPIPCPICQAGGEALCARCT
ncbi:hypothetical protein COCSUDRAFT_68429 [Coccomyxa subellipsoidea C-169]|uniref:Uncharacterized protein n=1 Tax=Coccomyxa subellipsoidea (strain C-169) TaxID=574566 RepID=I0YHY9_COCSC|nr:hypothetical protein COCSUDRAFT_68429 [Coccomyxa subellipsoidea C-169]EIE18008.1 hypothetical protein COCSUDRAFT_68429 [Coccomyxa subellipsoidea C-169]|eukprot:XP_005642552.1 hypothetical protein COCSUDRAFT_68429 [Coccomyxa subellipsoidea C-169]